MTLQASLYGSNISSFICPATPRTRTAQHRPATLIRCQVEPSDKSVEIMRKFSEQYARKSGTYFCVDKGVTSVVIKKKRYTLKKLMLKNFGQGLADHKDSLGAPLCPCRLVSLLSSGSCPWICIFVDFHYKFHIGIMMTNLLKPNRAFGTVHVFR
ncbi:hypothetical protein Patl1_21978 [Pistacia atlantica]|uniref:Uncharacterized protein n=1 Tax=Pistacia atlantica TaxID=434234 RepID=A0ACC1BLC9_9ROSI|nr:hypothetical protein Patl1_21978 [Pistacia atlantica]